MSTTSTSSTAPLLDRLNALFQPLARSDAPGVVVGIAREGTLLYRRGFGMASLEHAVANTPATRMRIGSTTKHFTCLAVLMLAAQGRLDLDDPVRRHVSGLSPAAGSATLRQLMNHSGGVRCHLDLNLFAHGLAPTPVGHALATLARQSGTNFTPGEKMMYSNGGYHLLSLAVDRVSGVPLERFLQECVFTPLGMADTVLAPSDHDLLAGMATLHVPLPAGGYRRGIFPNEELRGEGGMVSTVDDLLRWMSHLRQPAGVVDAATWSRMTAPTVLSNGVVNPYGLGLMRHGYRGVEVIHHPGGVLGGACQMLMVPAHAIDIVILSNGASASPISLAYRALDELLIDAPLADAPPTASSARFGAVVGRRYASPAGAVVAFVDLDGKLGLSFYNGPPVPVEQTESGVTLPFQELAVGPLDFTMPPTASGSAAPERLVLTEGGHQDVLTLLPDEAGGGENAMAALTGRYVSADLDVHADIQRHGDGLVLRFEGSGIDNALPLELLGADVVGWHLPTPINVPQRGVLRIERRAGGVEGFLVHTARTRGLHFRRLHDASRP